MFSPKWIWNGLLALSIFPLGADPIFWNGTLYDDETVARLITVITTTNPIPSIPSLKHIYFSQKSLFLIPAFALCKKIIVFDGIQPEFEDRKEDYEKYKRKIAHLTQADPNFSNTELVFCDRWVHLSGAIREALAHVDTPYIFIHQHDMVLVKRFDLNRAIATMDANCNVKHVRLALPYTNLHWLPFDPPAVDQLIVGPCFVPLCRHFIWSDNDHVATAEYYREFVLPQCGHGPMEEFLNPALEKAMEEIDTACHPIFGTYLYGTIQDGGYISHSDGRFE